MTLTSDQICFDIDDIRFEWVLSSSQPYDQSPFQEEGEGRKTFRKWQVSTESPRMLYNLMMKSLEELREENLKPPMIGKFLRRTGLIELRDECAKYAGWLDCIYLEAKDLSQTANNYLDCLGFAAPKDMRKLKPAVVKSASLVEGLREIAEIWPALGNTGVPRLSSHRVSTIANSIAETLEVQDRLVLTQTRIRGALGVVLGEASLTAELRIKLGARRSNVLKRHNLAWPVPFVFGKAERDGLASDLASAVHAISEAKRR